MGGNYCDVEKSALWIVSVVLWLSYIFTALCFFTLDINQPLKFISYALTGFLWILQIMCSYFSANLTYTRNIHSLDGFQKYFATVRNNPPIIEFHGACYHSELDGEGRGKKIYSRQEFDSFEYVSWRDISEEIPNEQFTSFPLNSRGIIKLDLELKIKCSEDGTGAYYRKARETLFDKLRPLDKAFESKDIFKVKGFERRLTVVVKGGYHVLINLFVYIILSLSGFSLFFYILLDKLSVKHKHVMIKEISSFRNLNIKEESSIAVKAVDIILMQIKEAIENKEVNLEANTEALQTETKLNVADEEYITPSEN